jgi:small basic protein
MGSDVIACGFALFGVARLRSSRLQAYRWFERALLQTVFVTGVFAFLESQFGAAVGLLINIAVLLTVRVMINAELRRSLLRKEAAAPIPAAAPAAAPDLTVS